MPDVIAADIITRVQVYKREMLVVINGERLSLSLSWCETINQTVAVVLYRWHFVEHLKNELESRHKSTLLLLLLMPTPNGTRIPKFSEDSTATEKSSTKQ